VDISENVHSRIIATCLEFVAVCVRVIGMMNRHEGRDEIRDERRAHVKL
jgi:hypothetical protein